MHVWSELLRVFSSLIWSYNKCPERALSSLARTYQVNVVITGYIKVVRLGLYIGHLVI